MHPVRAGEGALHPNGPANPGSGRSSDASGDAGAGMMGEMMGRPRKELYPSLMEMPVLSPEQRRNLESQARGRINGEIDGIAAAEMDLRHAIAAGDVVAADRASGRIRYALDGVQSGVTVLRSLIEGMSPPHIAQNWFKAQMNLRPQLALVDTDGMLGVSWFHVATMALLAIFSAGMLAVYVARMRRANALVDRLMRVPAPTSSPASSPSDGASSVTSATSRSGAGGGGLPTLDKVGSAPDLHRGPARPGEFWKGKLRIAAIYPETPGVKTFRLQAADGGCIPFSFLPGQFLTYAAEIDGKTVRRSYTIASSAARTAYVETTIKREDGGLFSDYMHDKVREGDLLDVMGPSGAFTFTGAEAESVVLIGGGVGITPLMAAIRYLSDIAWPGQIDLVYGAQTTEQFIFRDELEYLQRRMTNLRVAATMVRAAGTSWMGSEGQITADFLRRAVPDLAKRRVHLCGPPGMMEAVRKTLGELGVPPAQIKTEAFGPARGAVPPPGKAVVEMPTPNGDGGREVAAAIGPATASIRFARSGKVAPLPPDRSVLEVAENVGVPIDYSCRAGVCGICKTHLLEGHVTMEIQDALTEDDKSKGIILACQAKSVGNLVVEA
ncbi:2Fe-2S iron-sulfur cluster-binding protein [Bradyrhizobium sp. CSA207]|uniref:2Fe-2S iron-sulfur cluster-binding protein n=1 Tax=Bradyrhizobium sp. CSA207 TaxID=2698826 RepID=UPI0023B20208|nr:2Fe-2S iron-sulfur cluster-binding protein [Bradyrhizobium sp. CSA207]